MTYRVQFKQRPADDWQALPAASAREARTIQQSYRRRFWIAVVQWWSDGEQRWI